MEVDLQYGLGHANLALNSFVASIHPAEKSCGDNGLPLTPNSIAILGQAEILKSLHHKHICTYLDCQRGQHERIVCVSEHYSKNLTGFDIPEDQNELLKIAEQALSALYFLESKGIVVINLSSSNIVYTGEDTVKIYNYGLGHMTDYGNWVSFSVFDPRSVAPEIIWKGLPSQTIGSNDTSKERPEEEPVELDSISQILPARKPPYRSSCAVWTLGMIVFAKAIGLKSENDLWPSLKLSQVLRKILSLSKTQDVLCRLSREFDCETEVQTWSPNLVQFLNIALNPDPDTRPSPGELLKILQSPMHIERPVGQHTFPSMRLRSADLELKPLNLTNDDPDDLEEDESPLEALTIQEVYYLWVLAGGDLMSELRRHGLMVSLPPVLTLPKIVLNEGHPLGIPKERCALFDPIVMILPMNQLVSCLSDLTPEDAYPLMLTSLDGPQTNGHSQQSLDEMANMPLIIKERDVKYQFRRSVIFRRLLQGYPFTRRNLWKEARLDTLPLYRPYIWASLLGIEHDVQARYEAIDKETRTATDRQIEVDIPRCHQYNSLLASPEGHRKFKRVLKAWVATNPQYVYWQGLDSLSAPFLYLNFNDEALAFACLQAFIPKYLLGMFRQDNAPVIQEYLAKFSHLQAFHDPTLFNHLDGIGFIPELYAIPWVLTMFAHVFPLSSIFHLWDKLLLGNESFPLCVALAILEQLRARLLESEFNDCILLFSDLPAIDIEECVNESIRTFCATPKSLTYRKCGAVGLQKADRMGLSGDTNVDLSLNSLTVEQQKRDKVPRMSGEELLMLLGLRPLKDDSEAHFVNPLKPKAVALDVRPKAEFKMGALLDSVNIPFQGAFDGNGSLQIKIDQLESAKQKKSKVICVVGSTANDHAREFAEALVRQNYHRVCYLHNGIEIFRTLNGILCVPDLS